MVTRTTGTHSPMSPHGPNPEHREKGYIKKGAYFAAFGHFNFCWRKKLKVINYVKRITNQKQKYGNEEIVTSRPVVD